MEQQRADAIARLSEAERAKQAAVSDLHEGSVSHAQEQANLREAWMREKEQLQLDTARMKEQMEGRHSDTVRDRTSEHSTLCHLRSTLSRLRRCGGRVAVSAEAESSILLEYMTCVAVL